MTFGLTAGAAALITGGIGAATTLGGAYLSGQAAKDAAKTNAKAMEGMKTDLTPYQFYGPGGQFAGFSDSAGGYPGMTQLPAGYGRINFGVPQAGAQQPGMMYPTGGAGGVTSSPKMDPRTGLPMGGQALGITGSGSPTGISGPARTGLGGLLDRAAAGPQAAAGVPHNISIGLGDLEPARAGLVGMGTEALGRAQGMGGLPSNIQQALMGTNIMSQLPGMSNTMGLQNATDSTLLNSLFDMNGGVQGAQASYLQNLRNEAQPFEQRAFNGLQNNLFSTGRLGSTGGGLQTEAFARGLGQADTSRQIQAQTMGNQMLNDAFGRFSQTAGLSQGLMQERFGNSMLLNSAGYDRSQQNLQNQIGAAQLPTALQGSQLQLALQALQGQGFLNDQGLNNFQASLASAQAGANARIGAGSNVAAMTKATQGNATGGDLWGQALTGIGGRLMGDKSVTDVLGGLFGGGGNKGGTYGPDGTYYPN